MDELGYADDKIQSTAVHAHTTITTPTIGSTKFNCEQMEKSLDIVRTEAMFAVSALIEHHERLIARERDTLPETPTRQNRSRRNVSAKTRNVRVTRSVAKKASTSQASKSIPADLLSKRLIAR